MLRPQPDGNLKRGNRVNYIRDISFFGKSLSCVNIFMRALRIYFK